MWQIWLIIAGICLIVEIFTVGFLIFWFSIGALIAMLISFFTTNIIIQTTVFVLLTMVFIQNEQVEDEDIGIETKLA